MITKLRYQLISVVGPGNQNRFAKEVGINQARLSQYATGTKKIPAHHLLTLSMALKCDPRDLVGYVDLPTL